MDERTEPGPEELGGRLPLLWPASLDDAQHALYARLQATLRRGGTPQGLRPEADAAHRLARAVIHDHEVPDGLYDQAMEILGPQAMITALNLAGQYLTTSAVLACFQVPAPPAR